MAATLTPADLKAMGRTVVNGVAVKIANQFAADVTAKIAGDVRRQLFRSKWEADRAALFEALKYAGQIKDFRYEPMRLRLADGAWYKPDFLVEEIDGSLTLEEVKGHWREAALVRYKVARSAFPMFAFRAVTKRRGQWVDAMEGKQ